MSQVKKNIVCSDRVSDFYDGKSVFMTGASGYLGVIILETLLRCCPGIRSVYILMREKKGVSPERRKDAIFKKNIFSWLREKDPDALKKVKVVAGDASLPDMGMCSRDLERVTSEVSIVFHIAACISFMKPLRYMLSQNSRPMDYVIDLCRKLKKVDVLVYTSTAYSNSNRKEEIEEQIYRLPFPAQKFLNELNNGNEDSLNKLASQCLPKWPNHYTFSKCLAENVILDKASDIPTVIVRPSIIVSCWKGILPGYIEEGSGMVDLGIAIGKGFVRVIPGDPNVRMDIIPVDVVANTHIVAAWSVASNRSQSPMIVNCTTSDICDTSLSKYTQTLFNMSLKHPLPKAFQSQGHSLIIQKHFLLYTLLSLIEHYAPAYFIDVLLSLSGKKPRLVKLYRFYDKAMDSLKHFMTTEYVFRNENLNCLSEQMTGEDKELLYTDLTGFTVDKMAESIPRGAPFYQWDIDTKRIAERKKVTHMRYMLTTSVKAVFLATIFSLLYLIISRVLVKLIV
ncbi:hypothetical protein JTE90_019528 [Oedothorax gibbosus]|uniref:Fatty acyl-CoA reductase n=1 Tax=Oedothorax gibbosus TaxID=931172 RepID=A0AAV6VFG1_9ARAC|nr:hypothetical protein JTE90_019528 [Oedothorax gibbosus]